MRRPQFSVSSRGITNREKNTLLRRSRRLQIFTGTPDGMGVDSSIIEFEPVFWTGTQGESSLFYPGKWQKSKIIAAEAANGIMDKTFEFYIVTALEEEGKSMLM